MKLSSLRQLNEYTSKNGVTATFGFTITPMFEVAIGEGKFPCFIDLADVISVVNDVAIDTLSTIIDDANIVSSNKRATSTFNGVTAKKDQQAFVAIKMTAVGQYADELIDEFPHSDYAENICQEIKHAVVETVGLHVDLSNLSDTDLMVKTTSLDISFIGINKAEIIKQYGTSAKISSISMVGLDIDIT